MKILILTLGLILLVVAGCTSTSCLKKQNDDLDTRLPYNHRGMLEDR